MSSVYLYVLYITYIILVFTMLSNIFIKMNLIKTGVWIFLL